MSESYDITSRNKVKRQPKKGAYDKQSLFDIIDRAYVCQVAFEQDGQTFIIPMAYGREGETLYLHGAKTSRFQQILREKASFSVNITLLDGIVVARSVFDHSFNYRSALMFGHMEALKGKDNILHALKIISDHVLPGRWDEARFPDEKELKATSVLAFHIEQASCKIRSGPPLDQKKDMDLPVWAGVIPFDLRAGIPEPDPAMKGEHPLPDSVTHFKIRK